MNINFEYKQHGCTSVYTVKSEVNVSLLPINGYYSYAVKSASLSVYKTRYSVIFTPKKTSK